MDWPPAFHALASTTNSSLFCVADSPPSRSFCWLRVCALSHQRATIVRTHSNRKKPSHHIGCAVNFNWKPKCNSTQVGRDERERERWRERPRIENIITRSMHANKTFAHLNQYNNHIQSDSRAHIPKDVINPLKWYHIIQSAAFLWRE